MAALSVTIVLHFLKNKFCPTAWGNENHKEKKRLIEILVEKNRTAMNQQASSRSEEIKSSRMSSIDADFAKIKHLWTFKRKKNIKGGINVLADSLTD